MNNLPELQDIAQLIARDAGFTNLTFCGKGTFKEIYRVQTKDFGIVALKLVDRSKNEPVRTQREIAALKRCDSPRIAKIFEARTFRSPDKRVFDIVLEEFFGGGTLEDRLRRSTMSFQQVVNLTVGLVFAVQDLYPLRLVHRDIKPANVMFRDSSDDPALVDFGLVRDLGEISLTPTWLLHGPGTPFYASPEQLNNQKHLIDWRSDQFSVGVIAGHLLTDQHPYQTDPADPRSAVQAALDRNGPAAEFRKQVMALGLPQITKMVAPWPVQRFKHPAELLAALTS